MANKYFNFSEVLGYGWSVMKANLWFFVGLGFVFLIITYIPTIIDIMAAQLLSRASLAALNIATTILAFVINIVLGIGLIKIALSFCDEQKPPIGMLFDAWDCFWRYVGAAILLGLIMFGVFVPCALVAVLLVAIRFPWLLLLIIPAGMVIAVRFGIQFGLCYYFVIDKVLGLFRRLRQAAEQQWALNGSY